MIFCDDQDQSRHIKAETVLTGKKIEEFSRQQGLAFDAAPFTIFPGFREYRFVRHRPCDTGDGYGQDKKPDNLYVKRHSLMILQFSCHPTARSLK